MKQRTDNLPVRAVIYFVGAIGMMALITAAKIAQDAPGSPDVASFKEIVLMAVTGLLALLGRTSPAESQRRSDSPPPETAPEASGESGKTEAG